MLNGAEEGEKDQEILEEKQEQSSSNSVNTKHPSSENTLSVAEDEETNERYESFTLSEQYRIKVLRDSMNSTWSRKLAEESYLKDGEFAEFVELQEVIKHFEEQKRNGSKNKGGYTVTEKIYLPLHEEDEIFKKKSDAFRISKRIRISLMKYIQGNARYRRKLEVYYLDYDYPAEFAELQEFFKNLKPQQDEKKSTA